MKVAARAPRQRFAITMAPCLAALLAACAPETLDTPPPAVRAVKTIVVDAALSTEQRTLSGVHAASQLRESEDNFRRKEALARKGAVAQVELQPTVADVETAWRELRDKMADLAPSLPDGAIGRVAVTTLALTGADYTMAELRAQARWLHERFSTLPRMGRIELYGVQQERIWLVFDRVRLSQLGLSASFVLNAVAEQNRILPAGALLSEDGMRYQFEPSGDFRSVAEIGNVPVRTPTGSVVYVRDIVNIERGYVDPPRRPVLFNGQPAVVLAISMVPGSAVQAFAAETGAALVGLHLDLPLGMRLDVATDQAPIVAESVADATSNLGQTLLTVLVIVMLFLGLRAGAIVGVIVPLTIFISLVGMLLWDIPIHRISIAAIIIGLGLLVDNGVVIAEDIKKRIDAGTARLADAERNPDVLSSVFYVAAGGRRFFLALSPLDPAPHVAFGVVNTARAADVTAVRARLEEFMASELPEARGWTERLFLGKEPPGTLEIRVSGPKIDELYQTGRRVEGLFGSIAGTREIRTNWANPVLQIDVLIDQERSRRAGLAPYAVARALAANFDGTQVTDYREGDRIIPVVLRAQPSDRASLDDLVDMTLVADDGRPVPLLQVATIAGELKPSIVHRYDLQRTITVSALHPGLTAHQLLAEVAPRLDSSVLPPGYTWVAGGEVEASASANSALFAYMPHCLLAIVVLLIWQFNSFRRTSIIVLTIPLIAIGAALGLLVTRAKLDFNAMLGLFSLAGIIVSNAIVMTTLTTIVGLVPLFLLGGELWRGMTVVMMFGLGVGTALTLGVVPVPYQIMFRARRSVAVTS